jgi:hypothetical protein
MGGTYGRFKLWCEACSVRRGGFRTPAKRPVSQPELQKKDEIEPREGVVGFFDILGFQSYLKNDPDVRSRQALQVLLDIKAEVPGRIKKRVPEAVVGEMSWNVFADSILLAMPYPETKDRQGAESEKRRRWLTFLFSSVVLLDHMFDQGLPIRGAISFGRFFCQKNCLAGRAVVEAHELEQRINLSGAVLHESAAEEFRGLTPESFKSGDGIYVYATLLNYLVPEKEVSKKRLVLNQWALSDDHDNDDIAQLSAEAFWKHGKDIDDGAAQKLRNTEMLLRFVVATKRTLRSQGSV